MTGQGAVRQLGPLLLLGMLTVPALFCWFFLRRGYHRSLRLAVFTYTGVITAVGITAQFAR